MRLRNKQSEKQDECEPKKAAVPENPNQVTAQS